MAFKDIAQGNADLTARLETNSGDEVGLVVKGFNEFVEKLQSIVTGIKKSNGNLLNVDSGFQHSTENTISAITEIISNIESVGGQINQQNICVTETSQAVDEISKSVDRLENMISTQVGSVSQASTANFFCAI